MPRLPAVLVVSALCVVDPLPTSAALSANPDAGETLFKQHCLACHSLNGVRIGPSLLEIAFLYKDNAEGIVASAIKPGRKRQQMIPMPPMTRLAKLDLERIADYILLSTKGKKIGLDGVSRKKLMPPTRNIQRILMPDSGPASIAVKLSPQMAYCWDAGPCRLRFVWTGGFISHTWGSGFLGHQDGNDRRYSFEKAVLKGLPFYVSGKSSPLRLGGTEARAEYRGYKIDQNRQPRFLYTINGCAVEESMQALAGDRGILRQFKIQDNTQPVTFSLTEQEGVAWSSDRGKWDGATLTLTAAEAREFTVTISITGVRNKK